MNCYKNYISMLEDNLHLISMVPVDEILRFGYEIGLNKNSKVLDLCCGYGTVLKIWNEAFGISGVGVDICSEFVDIGKERLKASAIEDITLICGDVITYQDAEKYDVVICSETIKSIKNTLALGEKFLKSGGVIAYQKLYSKVDNPPKELLDFDIEVLPLYKLNHVFNELGFYMMSMASDTDAKWEHYVLNWNGNRDWNRLKENPEDKELKQWIQTWYDMYFKYRRRYEGQALFGLKKI